MEINCPTIPGEIFCSISCKKKKAKPKLNQLSLSRCMQFLWFVESHSVAPGLHCCSSFIYVYVCGCVRVHVCTCVYMCICMCVFSNQLHLRVIDCIYKLLFKRKESVQSVNPLFSHFSSCAVSLQQISRLSSYMDQELPHRHPLPQCVYVYVYMPMPV